MKTSLLERQLLLAAKSDEMASIIDIVKTLSPQEKSSISPGVLDTVVASINGYAEKDRVESAFTMMMFVREIGAYLPPSAMAALLGSSKPARNTAPLLSGERVSAF